MNLLKPAALLMMASGFFPVSVPEQKPGFLLIPENPAPKIQVAILLDKSNSMDGLLEQAKSQLWNMVSVMGKAKCQGIAPQIEIALFTYGDPRHEAAKGYVKTINSFTTDLDLVSGNLFALTTNGGDEYCGHVIYTSVTELPWDTAAQNYKVIFIAGNEDFLQGDITYTKACAEAKKKGIIVNTLYCGDKAKGIAEHWNLGSECGEGTFSCIDQNAKTESIPTPYDSTLMVLNNCLNSTYLAYGSNGLLSFSRQAEADNRSVNDANKAIAYKRIAVKADKNLYRNEAWDLVDALEEDSGFLAKLDSKTLPDSLQQKSRSQLTALVKAKKEERASIQKEIETVNSQRESYISAEKKKRAANTTHTLETEIEKIVREQARRFNMLIQ